MEQYFIEAAGGVIGAVLGFTGGLLGTYWAFKKTKGTGKVISAIKFKVWFWILLAMLIVIPLMLSISQLIPAWIPPALLGLFLCFIGPFIVWNSR